MSGNNSGSSSSGRRPTPRPGSTPRPRATIRGARGAVSRLLASSRGRGNGATGQGSMNQRGSGRRGGPRGGGNTTRGDAQFVISNAATASQHAPLILPDADPNIIRAWAAGRSPVDGGADEYAGIGDRLLSDRRLPIWYRHGVAEDADKKVQDRTKVAEQQAWLASYPRWTNKLRDDKWIGKKILGIGSYGIAGLWERDEAFLANGVPITKVVVKQSGGSQSVIRHMKNEEKWLKRFRSRGTRHVVKIYGDAHYEFGQGTIASYDNLHGRVELDSATQDIGRMYLEFCEGGAFTAYIREMYSKYQADNPMPEELIWHIFRCFAIAQVAMEHGRETISGGSWPYEVTHFDIKPDNILVNGLNSTHIKTPIIKLADFGSTRATDAAHPASQNNIEQGGSPMYKPPEQTDSIYPQAIRRAGVKMNTWGFAKTLYCLITRGRQFNGSKDRYFKAEVGVGYEIIETRGPGLLRAPYSVLLRKTVLRCLAYDLTKRPSATELLGIIQGVIGGLDGTGGAEGAGGGGGGGGGDPGKPEPGKDPDLSSYINPDDMTVVGPFPPAGTVSPGGQGLAQGGAMLETPTALLDFDAMIALERREEQERIAMENAIRARAGGFPLPGFKEFEL